METPFDALRSLPRTHPPLVRLPKVLPGPQLANSGGTEVPTGAAGRSTYIKEGDEMITVDTTKDELKAKWKQMYQTRKKFAPNGVLPSFANYGYFTGKMEYTAWLLLNATEQPIKRS